MTQNVVIEEDSAPRDDIDRLFEQLGKYEPLPGDAFRLNLQVLRGELPGNVRSLDDHKKRRRNLFFPVLAAACTLAFAVLIMGMLTFGGVNDTAVISDNPYAATPALESVVENEQQVMRLYSRLDMVAEPGYYPTRLDLPLNFLRKGPRDAQTSLQFRPW
jgi:hypothetical protein